jgi:hypothetical protein
MLLRDVEVWVKTTLIAATFYLSTFLGVGTASQVGVVGSVYAYSPACLGSSCFTGFDLYNEVSSNTPIAAGIPLGTSGIYTAQGIPNSGLSISTIGTAKAGYGMLG